MPPAADFLISGQNTGRFDAIKTWLAFPAAYQSHFEDNFNLRQSFLTAYYSLRLNGLHERLYMNVLVGEEGWLYYTAEQNIDFYQRTRRFSDAELERIYQRLETSRAGLAERGIPLLVVIAPNKESIYPEHLPAFVRVGSQPSLTDQIITDLKNRQAKIRLLDLRPALLAGKNTAQDYYRTDTHWNPYGAYLAYAQIISALQPDFPHMQARRLDEYEQVDEWVSGDLAGFLHAPNDALRKELRPVLKPRFKLVSQSIPADGETTILTEIPGSSLPRVVIFHDSFFNALIPYMAEHFSQATFRWTAEIETDTIEQYQPDLVIYEIAERYLSLLAQP